MFERQFGLRENPFAAGHQSRFVYPSREHQEALAHLRYGIENREPFVLITGEVGTGKTTALYDVLAEWHTRVVVALITNSALTRDELLEEICVRFGVTVPAGASKPQLLMCLERDLLAIRARGDRAILLLDEAQNLDRALLEEIRLLSNLEVQGEKLVQVFLVGQPELEELLSQPELRQLRQRVSVHYRLSPLSQEDTERYIHHRITVAGGHAITVFPAELVPRGVLPHARHPARDQHGRRAGDAERVRRGRVGGAARARARRCERDRVPEHLPRRAAAGRRARRPGIRGARGCTSRDDPAPPPPPPPSFTAGPASAGAAAPAGGTVRPASSRSDWEQWMASLAEDTERESVAPPPASEPALGIVPVGEPEPLPGAEEMVGETDDEMDEIG